MPRSYPTWRQNYRRGSAPRWHYTRQKQMYRKPRLFRNPTVALPPRPELKKFTTELLGQSPVNVTPPTVRNFIAGGINDNERIGNTIVITSISARFCMLATVNSTLHCYRFMLIWDKQPNKALAILADIFVGAPPHHPNDFNDLESRDRFVTVWNSGTFIMGGLGSDNDGRAIEFYCKCRAQTVFSDNAGVIGSMVTGALLFVQIRDGGIVAEAVNGDYQFRLRYTDGRYGGKPMFWGRKVLGNPKWT